MEEPLPVLDSPREAPQPPAISLAARLLNVFAIPGEVFAGVKASPNSLGNWLLPALVLAMVGVVLALTNVPQAVFQRQIHEVTEQYAKVLEDQVKAGRMKQPDVDRGMALARSITSPALLKPLFSVGIPVAGVARLFWWALMLWLLGRWFLKVRFGYDKALEVAGLGLMINVLGTVVMLLLLVNLPKLFSAPGLAFARQRLRPKPAKPAAGGCRQRLFHLAAGRALDRPGQTRRRAFPPGCLARVCRLGYPASVVLSRRRSAGACRLGYREIVGPPRRLRAGAVYPVA